MDHEHVREPEPRSVVRLEKPIRAAAPAQDGTLDGTPDGTPEANAVTAGTGAPGVPAPSVPPAPAVPLLGAPPYAGRRPPSYPAVPQGRPRMADETVAAALVPDIVLDGAAHGPLTLRAASVRGDSHRYLGETRQDSVMTAHLGEKDAGELLALAVADGVGSQPLSHIGAQQACQRALSLLGAHAAELYEALAAGRGDVFAELAGQVVERVADHLAQRAGQRGLAPVAYSTTLRVLLVPLDPDVRTRGLLTVGDGGTALLRDGVWDLAPGEDGEKADGDRMIDTRTAALPLARTAATRLLDSRPGDVLLVCTDGFSSPLAGAPEMRAFLAGAWGGGAVPEPADFLWQFQYRVKSYDDDRSAAVVWEGRP
ncbi:protein phosphatase 2C domain-containing protein [Streptomyces sp. NPDC058955]|uniref:protein phosphatase 2C domain-containing protein n=1 Tax=unclassified Streptomyces TaxID=2593676 RepID=UPI00365FB4DB